MIKMASEKIKANFHGHLLAGFAPWWRKQFGIEGKNLVQVVTDKCLEKGLEIYTITNDFPEEFRHKSRFHQFVDEARSLNSHYKLERLGDNSIIIEKGLDGKVIYLNGQSIEDRILTFGTSSLPKNLPLTDAAAYLRDNGYLRIAEHPFAGGHHGALTEEQLLEMWDRNLIDAAEHDGKITVPFPFSLLPKFGDYQRTFNKKLEKFCEYYGIPFIANDDSDGISHIGTAWTEFDKIKINTDSENNLIQDLNTLIKKGDFQIHKGYLSFPKFLKYIYLVLKSQRKN
jgi:predicted metal-dependent phosphoesterase TrpH